MALTTYEEYLAAHIFWRKFFKEYPWDDVTPAYANAAVAGLNEVLQVIRDADEAARHLNPCNCSPAQRKIPHPRNPQS